MNSTARLSFELGLKHVAHLSRGRFCIVLSALGLVWTVLFAWVARSAAAAEATTETLLGPVFGVAVPLSLFAYSRYLGRARLRSTTTTAVILGADRTAFSGGAVFAVTVAGGVLALTLSTVAVVLLRGFSDPALAFDLFTTAWVSLLGGAVYTCCFTGLATAGVGAWSFVFLILDWLLGSGSGYWALLWPRAHLANLLGVASPLPLTQSQSALVLFGFFLAWAVVLNARLRH